MVKGRLLVPSKLTILRKQDIILEIVTNLSFTIPLELTKIPKNIEMKVKATHTGDNLAYRISIDLQLQEGFGKELSALANVALKVDDQTKTCDVLKINSVICRSNLFTTIRITK